MSFWRAIKMLLTLRCQESHRLLSDACDRDLSPVERWAVRLHQVSCGACRRMARQIRAINLLAKARAQQTAPLPDAARERIAAAIAASSEAKGQGE